MATDTPRNACDLERAEPLPEDTIEWPPPTKSPLDQSGTVCFVCLDRPRDGQYAVQVQCLKSKRERKIHAWRIGFVDEQSPSDTPSQLKKRKETPIYEPLQPWDKVLEDDRAVYIRMLNVCFQYMGEWKKWLPFYGVVSVTEVMFQFDGRISRDGRFSGLMTSVDVEKTKKDRQQAIKMEPIPDTDNNWDCCYDDYHA